jgi:hypothetical protein
MQIVKSVGVLSVAKIMGLIYGCMGLMFVPLFLLFGLIGSLAEVQQKTPFAGIFGVVFAFCMPIFYGLLGFLFGALGALLYNLFSRLVGGFEVELELRPANPVAPYPLVPPANPAL